MLRTTPLPDSDPKRALTQEMELANKQAEKLKERAEALRKLAQRYTDSSTEQSHYSIPHQQLDP
ncbi:MAG: hypothetical protein ACFB15_19685 [Cyclobacteriaceae bacterium]